MHQRNRPEDDFKHVSEIPLDGNIVELLNQRMALLMLKKSALKWEALSTDKVTLQLKALEILDGLLNEMKPKEEKLRAQVAQ